MRHIRTLLEVRPWYVLPIVLVTLRVTQAPHAEREEYVFKTYHDPKRVARRNE
jgi:hypothetical protein